VDGLLPDVRQGRRIPLRAGLRHRRPDHQGLLWFYLGYSPTLRSIERTPYEKTSAAKQDITDHFFAGNIKGNIGSKLVFKLSANITPSKTEGSLPALDGSTPDEADLDVDTKLPTSSYSAYADYVPSSNFYVSGRVGMYETDTQITGSTPRTGSSSGTALSARRPKPGWPP
jgi:hypothetical protein